jgi:transcriptional regulator with XRE-family HTH domain
MPDQEFRGGRLREFREGRGLTQQEVAEQVTKLAWIRGGVRVGVNADMVSKWERGSKRPSKLYRELLCLLYETPAAQLGISGRMIPVPTGPESALDAALAETLVGATALLDELGPAGELLQPKVFEVWKDEVMKRRTVLKLLGIAPAALATRTSPTAAACVGTGAATQALDELATRYQQLYHSARPAHLMTPVLAHLGTVADVLRANPAAVERRQLLRNESRVGLLAGRMAFFDLHDAIGARGYYNLALEAAREAQDGLLAAAALGHIAFIPAEDRRFTAATDYLEGAERQLARNPHPLVSSWLAAVESEIQANAGNERGALEALDAAQAAISRHGEAAPGWFDFFDAGRLDGFRGHAYLKFKRFTEASAALRSSAAGLPANAVKQRAVVLTDVAAVHLSAGELEEACAAAGQAVDLLRRADYATGADRLREFRAQLGPWKNHPTVRLLDDQLAAI